MHAETYKMAEAIHDNSELWVKVEYYYKFRDEYPMPDVNKVSIGDALLWYLRERRKWLKQPESFEKHLRLWQLAQWRKGLMEKIEREREKWK